MRVRAFSLRLSANAPRLHSPRLPSRLTSRSSRPRIVASTACYTLRLHAVAASLWVGLTPALGLMNKMIRFYPTLLAIALTFGTPILCVLVTLLFSELCWPQRVGAVYVGAAVFMQGYIAADPDRFSRKLSDGITLRSHLNQASFTVAIFGTLFAALGDLPPPSFYFGVQMCPA